MNNSIKNSREANSAVLGSREEASDRQIIIGRNPVAEAIKSGGDIDIIYVNRDGGGSLSNIVRLAREKGLVIKETTQKRLSELAGGDSHQGVVATVACAAYSDIEDILELAKSRGEDPFIIICDGIEDPHNLGAIIRTAECAGAHGIILPKRRSASLGQTVFKTSAGAASWLPVARVSNIPQAIDRLKELGIWIYGTDASGSLCYSTSLLGPIALVIGSEGNGIGRLTASKCDGMLSVPLMGRITSLNASVAAGVFMYEILRQRNINSGKESR